MKTRLPNIILTIADDQRATALGCAEVEPVRTPNLDRLARRGTRFSNAHHFGSPHGAVCAPSRAMLMTGLPYFQLEESLICPGSPVAHPASSLPPSLPQLLRQKGYHTFATGKWHNGPAFFHPAFSSGANLFFGGMADHWFTPVHSFDPEGVYDPAHRLPADGFSTEVFARSAIDFIRSRRNDSAPFFCYCAFTAPHDPRTPPDAYRRMYDPAAIQLPPNITADRPFDNGFYGVGQPPDNGSLRVRDEMLLGVPRDPAEIRRSVAEYYGMISHMDEWIGKIHDAVTEIGADRNTLIIHTADHGLAVGQHGLLGKQNLFQHSVTVPLILAGPGIAPNHVDPRLCYQHDLNPTLKDLAEITATKPGVFQSLLSSSSDRTAVGTAFGKDQRMIRDSRHKWISYRTPEPRGQLFDLFNDPWETCNLADNPSHQEVLRELKVRMREWQQAAQDPAAAPD
jgi:arylsulfatase A-like enzyme